MQMHLQSDLKNLYIDYNSKYNKKSHVSQYTFRFVHI